MPSCKAVTCTALAVHSGNISTCASLYIPILAHYHDGEKSLEACSAKLAVEGRTVLIKHLKDAGVDKLADRQKLATAIAKAAKESAAPLDIGS